MYDWSTNLKKRVKMGNKKKSKDKHRHKRDKKRRYLNVVIVKLKGYILIDYLEL